MDMKQRKEMIDKSDLPAELKAVLQKPAVSGRIIDISAHSDARVMISVVGPGSGFTWFLIDMTGFNAGAMLRLATFAAEKQVELAIEEDPARPHYVKAVSVTYR